MLELRNISVRFKQFALKDINLNVKAHDYFVLLGSSGSGKSVLLEIIAGLVEPDSGTVFLNNRDITKEKIQKRKIGLVFQDYAIFTHYTVFENIAFPLKQVKTNKQEIDHTVKKLAKELEIEHILYRKPVDLSGGEKQRVALARTLAMKPDILLLDEPLSALDTKLRWETRMLLRKLNKEGQTIIHVTHDYEEAVVLANQVAIINKGIIEQTGSPKEIFSNPRSSFIASLTGIKNYFKAEVIISDEEKMLRNVKLEDKIDVAMGGNSLHENGFVIIQSNEIVLSKNKLDSSMLNNFHGLVKDIIHTRFGIEVLVDIGIPLYVDITEESLKNLMVEIDKKIWVGFKATALKFIPD